MKKRNFTAILLAVLLLVGCGSKENVETKKPEEIKEPEKKVEEKVEEKETVEEVKLEDVKFLDDYEKKAIEVEYKPTEIEAKVPAYEIEKDLSNVKNIEYFGNFTDAQKKFIEENAFMLAKTKAANEEFFEYDQLFALYDANEYKNIPNFVTTDSMAHVFHIFYDGFLREIEKNELYEKSVEMTEKLLKSNIEIYNNLENERLKEIELKNVEFFAVGSKLLGLEPENLPKEAEETVNAELKLIEDKALADSKITGGKVDYSQMTVRGHYTRDEILEKYFKFTMYSGQIGLFPFDDFGMPDEDAILQALLITYSAYNDPEVFKTWTEVTDPINLLVESADDLSIRDYGKVLYSVYGKEIDLEKLDDEKKLETCAKLIQELPKPMIAEFLGQSFRFIPQRKVLDNVMMQNVVDVKASLGEPSKRPIYTGLDVSTMLGNKKAKELSYQDKYNSYWDKYKERTKKNISLIESMSDSGWQKNMYRGWLWMLKSYNNEYGEGYPKFMQNENWKIKDIASSLGSYAELKHDTVLYGKPVVAEAGGGGPMEIPKGYVEPNLEFFEKLSWLLEYTKVNLKDREMLSEDKEEKLDYFKETVDRLATVVKKELNNETLTKEEYYFLYEIGGYMESIMINFVENDSEYAVRSWYEIENQTDVRMPVVVDLMNVVENVCDIPEGKILSIATGAPTEIYAVFPIEGELYMGRGAVFSYYEFLADERLTDEKWQKELLQGTNPELPSWYKDIVFEEKEDFEGNTNYGW